MKPSTRFIKLFYKLPEKARRDLVFKPYGDCPRSIQVIALEISQKTKRGKEYLEEMGFTEGSAEQ